MFNLKYTYYLDVTAQNNWVVYKKLPLMRKTLIRIFPPEQWKEANQFWHSCINNNSKISLFTWIKLKLFNL